MLTDGVFCISLKSGECTSQTGAPYRLETINTLRKMKSKHDVWIRTCQPETVAGRRCLFF